MSDAKIQVWGNIRDDVDLRNAELEALQTTPPPCQTTPKELFNTVLAYMQAAGGNPKNTCMKNLEQLLLARIRIISAMLFLKKSMRERAKLNRDMEEINEGLKP